MDRNFFSEGHSYEIPSVDLINEKDDNSTWLSHRSIIDRPNGKESNRDGQHHS